MRILVPYTYLEGKDERKGLTNTSRCHPKGKKNLEYPRNQLM